MQQEKYLIYLYELPKSKVTSVQIAEQIRTLTGYEITEIPQIRRDPNKPFYTAIIKINDNLKFKEIVSKIKYLDFGGCECRVLPYDKELLGVNRARANLSNVFVKGLKKLEITKSQ